MSEGTLLDYGDGASDHDIQTRVVQEGGFRQLRGPSSGVVQSLLRFGTGVSLARTPEWREGTYEVHTVRMKAASEGLESRCVAR